MLECAAIRMPKSSPTTVAPMIIREIRAALDARADEKCRLAAISAQPKSPVKTLGVRSSNLKSIAKETLAKLRLAPDYAATIALMDTAVTRKIREEILISLELLDRFRREFDISLFPKLEKWAAVTEDLELAEAFGSRLAAPLLAMDPSRMTVVRKWAKLKSVGKRRFAVLAAMGLVTEGRREATAVLDLCEFLLNEDNPILVAEIGTLLRETTRVDAKAVQDFLFRRSVDANPDILRAGSQNLDAARRAALIAKLEAQSGVSALVAAER